MCVYVYIYIFTHACDLLFIFAIYPRLPISEKPTYLSCGGPCCGSKAVLPSSIPGAPVPSGPLRLHQSHHNSNLVGGLEHFLFFHIL